MGKYKSQGEKLMQRMSLKIKKQTAEINTIKSFLLSLLGKRQINFPFEVKKEGENIKITVQEKHAQAIIDVMQKDFRKNLPFKMQSNNQPETSDEETVIDYDLLPLDNTDDGKKVMLNLFGKKAFKALKLDVEETFKGARFKDKVLFLQTDEDEDIHEVFEATQRYLCSYFIDVPRSRIQNAWLGKEALSKVPMKNLPTIPEGPVKQCFGVSKQSGPGGKSELYIDLGQLEKLIFPPKVIKKPTKNGMVELTIDAKHFNSFIRQFSYDGMMLRVTKTPNQAQVRPIFIAPGSNHPTPKKPELRILADISGSMVDSIQNVRKFLLATTNRALNEGAEKVKITPFSTKVHSTIVFTSSTSQQERARIINTLEADGNTAMVDAIASELDQATPAQLAGTENFNLIIITDGVDNNLWDTKTNTRLSEEAKKAEYNKLLDPIRNKIKKFKVPPNIFTVGQGNCDNALLTELALAGGTPYIQLKDPTELNEIFDHLPDPADMMSEQEKLQLSIEVAGQARKSYTVPLIHNGKLQSPEIVFPFQEGQTPIVTFNGREYLVSPNFNDIPEADLLDHLLNIEIESHQAIVDLYPDIKTTAKKIADLREKLRGLRSSAYGKEQEEEINELDAHLKGMQEDIELGKNNAGIYDSLYTRAKNWQGFSEIGTVYCDTAEMARSGGHCGLETNSASRLGIPNPVKGFIGIASGIQDWFFPRKAPSLPIPQPTNIVPPVATTQPISPSHAGVTTPQSASTSSTSSSAPLPNAKPKHASKSLVKPVHKTCKPGDNLAQEVAHRAGAALTRPPKLSVDDKLAAATALFRMLNVDVWKPVRPWMKEHQEHVLSENVQIKAKLKRYLDRLNDESQEGFKARLISHSNSKYLDFRLEQTQEAMQKLESTKAAIVCALNNDKITRDQFKKIEKGIADIESTLSENKKAKHANRQRMLRGWDVEIRSSGKTQTFTPVSKSVTKENHKKAFTHGETCQYYLNGTPFWDQKRSSGSDLDLDDLSMLSNGFKST